MLARTHAKPVSCPTLALPCCCLCSCEHQPGHQLSCRHFARPAFQTIADPSAELCRSLRACLPLLLIDEHASCACRELNIDLFRDLWQALTSEISDALMKEGSVTGNMAATLAANARLSPITAKACVQGRSGYRLEEQEASS
eukprot:294830-Pelagomonas_calceolata.AAC.6